MPAALYEEVTWAHGGLYEAFQVLADPRRVVFAMGVVDDGPHTHHEGGDGFGENGWPEVSPVEGLLGLSVQQVSVRMRARGRKGEEGSCRIDSTQRGEMGGGQGVAGMCPVGTVAWRSVLLR